MVDDGVFGNSIAGYANGRVPRWLVGSAEPIVNVANRAPVAASARVLRLRPFPRGIGGSRRVVVVKNVAVLIFVRRARKGLALGLSFGASFVFEVAFRAFCKSM